MTRTTHSTSMNKEEIKDEVINGKDEIIRGLYKIFDKLEKRIASLEKVLASHAKCIGRLAHEKENIKR